jgi:HD-GYP domain-containing protein (c-di-GMP phosphodiesterase class II)
VAEIERQAGQQFDPKVVAAFLRALERGELALEVPHEGSF